MGYVSKKSASPEFLDSREADFAFGGSMGTKGCYLEPKCLAWALVE